MSTHGAGAHPGEPMATTAAAGTAATRKRAGLKRLIPQSPLVQFLLIGSVLFIAHEAVERIRDGQAIDRIVITDATLEDLKLPHRQAFGRDPTDDELQALIREHIRREALVRDAVQQNVHMTDEAVRGRLIEVMEFFNHDGTPVPAPTEAELRRFIDAHPQRFRNPPRVTLTHVLFARDRHGAAAEGLAKALADKLRAAPAGGTTTPADPLAAAAGKASDGPTGSGYGTTYYYRTEGQLAIHYGPAFARTVMGLAPGVWTGPIASDAGVHVVRVEERAAENEPFPAEVVEAFKSSVVVERAEANTGRAVARYRVILESAHPRARAAAQSWGK
jgi:peptidyl-prolyl cis-trans isomerase C